MEKENTTKAKEAFKMKGKTERGDFYIIKFLDKDLLDIIINTDNLNPNRLMKLGQSYAAILERDCETFRDFCVLGDVAPIIQLRITKEDVKSEKVFVKKIASIHDRVCLTAKDTKEMTLPEIQAMIDKITNDTIASKNVSEINIRQLEDMEIPLVQKMLEPLVGRYFKCKINPIVLYRTVAFRVSGVPQPTLTMMNRFWNPYEIPVMAIRKSDDPNLVIKMGNVHSNAYKEGIEAFTEEYEEITKEEFDKILAELVYKSQKNLIKSISKEDYE